MEIPATRARRSVSLSLPGLGTPPPLGWGWPGACGETEVSVHLEMGRKDAGGGWISQDLT